MRSGDACKKFAPVDRPVVSEEWALASKFAHSVISQSDGVNTNKVFGWCDTRFVSFRGRCFWF